jgi:hypothetical protein
MKLYPIIYSEAARTATEALSKDVVAISSPERGCVTLVDRKRVLAAIDKNKKTGDINPASIGEKIASRALVGTITYTSLPAQRNLLRVTSSAGVNGFGVLAYQVAMAINPRLWLRSDASLTSASQVVWNKMYEHSQKGVYKRKFLGDFPMGSRLLTIAREVSSQMKRLLQALPKDLPQTEIEFLALLQQHNIPANLVGQFWVYNLAGDPDPKIKEMIEGGKQLATDMIERFGGDNDSVANAFYALQHGEDEFFNRLYRAQKEIDTKADQEYERENKA